MFTRPNHFAPVRLLILDSNSAFLRQHFCAKGCHRLSAPPLTEAPSTPPLRRLYIQNTTTKTGDRFTFFFTGARSQKSFLFSRGFAFDIDGGRVRSPFAFYSHPHPRPRVCLKAAKLLVDYIFQLEKLTCGVRSIIDERYIIVGCWCSSTSIKFSFLIRVWYFENAAMRILSARVFLLFSFFFPFSWIFEKFDFLRSSECILILYRHFRSFGKLHVKAIPHYFCQSHR